VLAVAIDYSADDRSRHRGPGDPLANPEKTFKTFELIAKTAPDIKLCLSTNGLALPDHVDTIAGFNVDHVTITINMVTRDRCKDLSLVFGSINGTLVWKRPSCLRTASSKDWKCSPSGAFSAKSIQS